MHSKHKENCSVVEGLLSEFRLEHVTDFDELAQEHSGAHANE